MNIKDFIIQVKDHDSKNQIEKTEYNDILNNTSPEFELFYTEYNPKNVYLRLKENGILHFFQLEELSEIKKEYGVNNYLIFASIDGDPIAIKINKIFFGMHGTQDYNFGKEFDSFNAFIDWLSEQIE